MAENYDPLKSLASGYATQNLAAADSLSIPSTLLHGLVASTVDAGVSIFNSLPGTKGDAQTSDILSKIDKNALEVYNEHSDTIHSLSFVEGSFAPIGISSKIMTMLRDGSKAVNWFTEAGRVSRLAKVENLYKEGLAQSSALSSATSSYYLARGANAIADATAMEVATNLAMWEHPFMEDYRKDWGSNFLTNLALGGGILGIGNQIIARGEVAAVHVAEDSKLFGLRTSRVLPVAPDIPYGAQVVERSQNIARLESILVDAKDVTLPSFTLSPRIEEAVKGEIVLQKSAAQDAFNAMTSEDIQLLPIEEKNLLQGAIVKLNVTEADSISFYRIPEVVGTGKKGAVPIPLAEAAGIIPDKTAFSLAGEQFIPKSIAPKYTSIADTVTGSVESSLKTLAKESRAADYSVKAREEFAITSESLTGAALDREHAIAFLRMQKASIEDLGKIVISKGDFPLLKAVTSRARVLEAEGKDMSSLKITMAIPEVSQEVANNQLLRGKRLDRSYLSSVEKLRDELKTPKGQDSTIEAIKAKLEIMASPEGLVYLPKVTRVRKNGTATYLLDPSVSTKLHSLRVSDITDMAWRTDGTLEIKAPMGTDSIKLPKVTPVAASTAQVSFDELNQLQGFTSMATARDFQAIGYPPEYIAKYLGQDMKGLDRFTSEDSITAAMHSSNRLLELKSNRKKLENQQIKAQLNAAALNNIDASLLGYWTQASPSKLVRDIGVSLESKGRTTVVGLLKKALPEVMSSKIGSTFWQSSNFALDKMGAAGIYITELGKGVTAMQNSFKQSIVNPLSQVAADIARDDLARIEASTALNFLSSLTGKRLYHDGKFYTSNSLYKKPLDFDAVLSLDKSSRTAYLTTRNVDQELPFLEQKYFGADYAVISPKVGAFLESLQNTGRDLLHLHNANANILGRSTIEDSGFWVPPRNTVGKEVAYAFEKSTGRTSMFLADTDKELVQLTRDFHNSLPEGQKLDTDIIFKGQDQELFNKLADVHDPIRMGMADSAMHRTGSLQSPTIDMTSKFLSDLMQGYDSTIDMGIDRLVKLQYAPITDHLNAMSYIAKAGGGDKTSHGELVYAKRAVKDGGSVVRNILLGRDSLGEHATWKASQNWAEVKSDIILTKISRLFEPALGKKGEKFSEKDWLKLSDEMEKLGIVNPARSWEMVDGQLHYYKDLQRGATAFANSSHRTAPSTARSLALMSSLAATSVLRVLGFATGAVNAMSLPILTSAAIKRQLPKEFAGMSLNGEFKSPVMETIINGVRLMNDPVAGAFIKQDAIQRGILNSNWRDLNDIIKHVRTLDPSITSKIEGYLDSALVAKLSSFADDSEGFVRTLSYSTGYAMAKKAYPGISHEGASVFASRFMDESVGNYNASQKAAVFKGVFGAALGLFQTYVHTAAQHTYRAIGNKDWASLVALGTTQSAIFGVSSLPGFSLVSEMIGKEFSDDHYDLETGTFRALKDPAASVVLYGLPSLIGGFYTRGDIQPRVPNPLALSDSLALIAIAKQAGVAAWNISKQVGEGTNAGTAILQAISLQSVSRPLARMSELVTGESITQKYNVVDSNTLMKGGDIDTLGILSRAFGVRPTEEVKAREAEHLNSMYGSFDYDNRQAILQKIKSRALDNSLTELYIEQAGEEYFRRHGTPTGYRAAVNAALLQSSQEGTTTVLDRLRPDTPFNQMVNDLN